MNHDLASGDGTAAAKAAPPARLGFFASLRWRVIALILAVSVPAAAWYVYDAFRRWERELEIALEGGRRQVENVAAAEGFVLGPIKRELEVLASNPNVAALRQPECAQALDLLMKRMGDVLGAAVFDVIDQRVCAAPPPRAQQPPLPAWTAGVLAGGKFAVLAPHYSGVLGQTVVSFVLPVRENGATPRMIVGFAQRPAVLTAALARLQRPLGSVFILFQRDGTIVARVPDAEKYVGRNIRDFAGGLVLEKAVTFGRGTAETIGVDGVRRVAAFAPFGGPDSGLYLALGFNREQFVAPARRALFIALGQVSILAAVVAVLFWFGMNGTVLRPLAVLQRRVRAFGAGRAPDPPARGGRGEIAALERDFEAMMAGIEDQRRALAEHARTLEAQVEARTRNLSEANAELEAYAHLVSHNLRAPMRQIAVHAANLVEDHGASLPRAARETAERMAAAAGRTEESLAALHAFMRLANTEFALAAVDLDAVVASALEQVTLDPATAAVNVRAPLGRVRAHAEALRQAVASLVANATKYVEPGATAAIEISSERRVASRRLWVKDAGIGIAPEHHERVFAMFERLHGDEAYPGSGAGLAVARRAVERMGGTIGVESRLGAGSRFWIDLPEAEQPG